MTTVTSNSVLNSTIFVDFIPDHNFHYYMRKYQKGLIGFTDRELQHFINQLIDYHQPQVSQELSQIFADVCKEMRRRGLPMVF